LAGKVTKVYYLNDICSILEGFVILNPAEEYWGCKSFVKVQCKACNIVSNKKLNTLTSKCRNCEMKKAKAKRVIAKFNEIVDSDSSIISIDGDTTNNARVLFICKSCNCKSSKLYNKFINNKICNTCAYVKSSKTRESRRESKLERFTSKLNKYNETYTIPEYIDEYSVIDIKCNQCDTFVTDKIYRVKRHMYDNHNFKCRECTQINKIQMSAYNLVNFYEEHTELGAKTGYLYMYTITVNGAQSFKLGITRNGVKNRIQKVRKLYDVTDVCFVSMSNLESAKCERLLKRKYSKYKIKPDKKFEGYTECFTVPVLLEEKMKVQRLSLERE